MFDKLGTFRDDLLVAIGPAISKKNYLVDKKTLKEFYKKAEIKDLGNNLSIIEKNLDYSGLNNLKEQSLNQLDLRRCAFRQLSNERIPYTNIDISNICTYDLKNEFNSWRRTKTIARQWNLICS